MDRGRKWKYRALAALQVLAAAAIAGTVICLLYRYLRYGERSAREAGLRSGSAVPEIAETESDGAGLAGTERAGIELSEAENEAVGQGKQLPSAIRVRILTDDFSGGYHDRVELTCEEAFVVKRDGKRVRKGKSYSVSASELEEGQVLQIIRKGEKLLAVESLNRADGHPQYAGELWLYREAEGIVIVNELPLEEYLCGVVASEMPSDYPEEAQKAQAVCARTYACNCIRNMRSLDMQESMEGGSQEAMEEDAWSAPAADLDDSVNDQVYNNYQATEQSRRAVEATEGEILPLSEIQYYSTSCQTEHREDLDSDEAFREFLSGEPDEGAEYDSPWLRWEAEISAQDILRELAARYGRQADQIDEIRVTKRAGNGQAQELLVRYGGAAETVKGEYAIRQLLSPARTAIRLRDGEEHSGMKLLPSAFFWLEVARRQEPDGTQGLETEMSVRTGGEDVLPIGKVVIHGGGYGHGRGMSQCGAAAMAKKGLDYREILEYYYQCEVSG